MSANFMDGSRLEQLLGHIKMEFPNFSFVKKSESSFMSFIDKVLMVVTFRQMQAFMKDYTTTIGTTVYTPSTWDELDEVSKISTLRHERVHMRQARRLGFPLFAFLYIFAWFPLGLARCRANFEMEAYAESMVVHHEYGRDILDKEYKAWMLSHFTGPAYGWMWPFHGDVDRWFVETAARVLGRQQKRK